MTNKEAIKIIQMERNHCATHNRDAGMSEEYHKEMQSLVDAFDLAIKALENSSWIPVKTRDLSAEEIEELVKGSENMFAPDEIEHWCYSCKLPEWADEVLITTRCGDVVMTDFCVDEYGCYFDGYEDRGDVLAWMPLPKPYTKEDDT